MDRQTNANAGMHIWYLRIPRTYILGILCDLDPILERQKYNKKKIFQNFILHSRIRLKNIFYRVPLTEKYYWADNSYYPDLECTIYGQQFDY